jgi:hypothetical protein
MLSATKEEKVLFRSINVRLEQMLKEFNYDAYPHLHDVLSEAHHMTMKFRK